MTEVWTLIGFASSARDLVELSKADGEFVTIRRDWFVHLGELADRAEEELGG